MAKQTRSKLDANVRREEIIAAASRLFSTKGFIATTIIDIMNELGVSGAAYYYYYDSKEDVLNEILDRALLRVEAELELLSARDDVTAAEMLERTVKAHARTIAENADSAIVMFSELGRSAAAGAKIRRRMRSYTERLISLYEEGVRNGDLLDVDARLAVYNILGQANWIAYWYPSDPTHTPAIIADELGASFARAYAPAAERDGRVPVPPTSRRRGASSADGSQRTGRDGRAPTPEGREAGRITAGE